MAVRAASTTTTTAPAASPTRGGFAGFPGTSGGKHGKLLGKPGGTAIRTLRPFPIAGPDKDLAVGRTLLAMKLV
jgi:hypothetical protein